jgi:cytoskeletal protein CcmA (bactofilin family)
MDDKVTMVDAAGNIQGKLTGRDARVQGRFEGEIELSGRLQIGEGGQVQAKVKVDTAEIGGVYAGELVARSVILLEKAKVEGSLTAETLAVRDGAQLNASVACGGTRDKLSVPAVPRLGAA